MKVMRRTTRSIITFADPPVNHDPGRIIPHAGIVISVGESVSGIRLITCRRTLEDLLVVVVSFESREPQIGTPQAVVGIVSITGIQIEMQRKADLLDIAQAAALSAAFPCLLQCGQQDRHQYGYDGNDDEEFRQCESPVANGHRYRYHIPFSLVPQSGCRRHCFSALHEGPSTIGTPRSFAKGILQHSIRLDIWLRRSLLLYCWRGHRPG